ncbi:hypothetical protein [Thiomonas sp. X19]|uniref:hypothetical protein n=1 Tax=Thiomonas sp. X19 TaxID=1050370 RepID=UPI001E359C45|nr:hypothetical protein [Thiomonas sp. X19]
MKWRIEATDLPQQLPTWTAADFGSDWLLHAQSASQSSDGKGHSTQSAEVTLYPMRSGELRLPPLSLGARHCAISSVGVAEHAPGEPALQVSTRIEPAQPVTGQVARIELDVAGPGGLNWEPVAALSTDARLRELPTLDTNISMHGERLPLQRHTWALLPLRAGKLDVRFSLLKATRFGELEIYASPVLPVQVRPLPAYWPADLPVGPLLFQTQPAPTTLVLGQSGGLRFELSAAGLDSRAIGRLLATTSQSGVLKMYPPRMRQMPGASSSLDQTWQIAWPFRVERAGAILYPQVRIPYYDPQLGAPRIALIAWGLAKAQDLRPLHLALGLLAAVALLLTLAGLRWAWCTLQHAKRRNFWRRIAKDHDQIALLVLWTKARRTRPDHDASKMTIRTWLTQEQGAHRGIDAAHWRLAEQIEKYRYGDDGPIEG